MKQKLLSSFCTMLIIGFLTVDFAAAQQEVTIRDLNTYDNLESLDDINTHPLRDASVQLTAVIVSNPRTSGLASYDGSTIGRIHVFVTDTTALNDPDGRDGMSMQIVQGSNTSAFQAVENLNRGDVVTVTGRLTFFNSIAQFVVDEIDENLGNARNEFDGVERYAPLLEPIEVSPADFHFATGDNQVDIDLEAYQIYHGAYVRISEGTMANYGGAEVDGVVERPAYTVNKDGVFVANRDIGLRYRNDHADDRGGYKDGYNFRRVDEDGFFERPPLGSAVNVNGFLVLDGFTDGFSYANGLGFNISPMEDGILWLTDPSTGEDNRLENGVSAGGTFTWPVDFEFIAAPPQVLDVALSPEPQDGTYTSDQTVTVSAIVAPPEDDTSVTIDSVVVNYSSASTGSITLQMTNTGGDNYSVELPELVDFEAPTLFVQAFGSNELAGRFPISGSISYFVDGGTITSIETIQRTGNDQIGPSPVAGLSDLVFDITATVTSAPADGIIAVQEGPNPWSGIFLQLGANTATLQRGDVVNITGGTVQEAEIASVNNNTYTYLSNTQLTIESRGADLSSVVPVLTTAEFNEPVAPGEAWEGMLVSFENVRMTADEGFGEVRFASIIDGTDDIQEESALFNWDTRSGTIGETGFPNNVNLHVILGNDLSKITGLVTYTFNQTKVIPRDLSDLEGDNFTIPRPQFNLNQPEANAEVNVVEDEDIVVTWQSLNPRDYDGDTVTFEWVLYSVTDSDTTEVVAVEADNDGMDAQVTLSYDVVDGLLDDLGVADSESIDVLWNVRASDGENTVISADGVDFDTRVFSDVYRPLTLTRGEATSGERFTEPVQFELNQNFPNPFNPTTTIKFSLPNAADVKLEVYNMIGQRVATLINNQNYTAGTHDVSFDASNLASGVYFYRIQAGSFTQQRSMTLIK